MKNDKTGSGVNLAEASKKRPQATESEAEYLARQAQKAKSAIHRAVLDIGHQIGNAAQPRTWAGQHPWIALGAAAATGFAAGSVVTPSRDQTLKERLKSLRPEKTVDRDAEPMYAAAPPKPSKGSMFIGPVMDAVKTVLVGAVSSAIAAKSQQPDGRGEAYDESQPMHGPTETL